VCCQMKMNFYDLQSSTEVSTLADNYSSTVTISDKVTSGVETVAAGSKVSSGEHGSWSRSDEESAGGRNPNLNKPHLVSDVDSEGKHLCLKQWRSEIL